MSALGPGPVGLVDLLAIAEAEPPGFAWWVLVPTLVLLSVAVAAAPIWPWSRRWGWPMAGIFALSAATAAIFTIGWWFS